MVHRIPSPYALAILGILLIGGVLRTYQFIGLFRPDTPLEIVVAGGTVGSR